MVELLGIVVGGKMRKRELIRQLHRIKMMLGNTPGMGQTNPVLGDEADLPEGQMYICSCFQVLEAQNNEYSI
jgi:hypothetical protein